MSTVPGIAKPAPHAFAASAAMSVGYQGRLFEISVSALVSTLFDVPERGVAVMGGLRIGLFGANL